MVVKIHIIYCGAWGYEPKYRQLRERLLKQFKDGLEITGEPTPNSTGYLEVQIVGGKLLHSKKNGDGYVDSEAKYLKIVKGIEEAMKSTA